SAIARVDLSDGRIQHFNRHMVLKQATTVGARESGRSSHTGLYPRVSGASEDDRTHEAVLKPALGNHLKSMFAKDVVGGRQHARLQSCQRAKECVQNRQTRL